MRGASNWNALCQSKIAAISPFMDIRMLPAMSGTCRKSRSSNPYAHTAARVGSIQRSRSSPRG
jgi:hypothetical protein